MLSMPENKAKVGGLVGELCLLVGAKVILTVNVDVNGARGTVQAIIQTGSEVSLVSACQVSPLPSRCQSNCTKPVL